MTNSPGSGTVRSRSGARRRPRPQDAMEWLGDPRPRPQCRFFLRLSWLSLPANGRRKRAHQRPFAGEPSLLPYPKERLAMAVEVRAGYGDAWLEPISEPPAFTSRSH